MNIERLCRYDEDSLFLHPGKSSLLLLSTWWWWRWWRFLSFNTLWGRSFQKRLHISTYNPHNRTHYRRTDDLSWHDRRKRISRIKISLWLNKCEWNTSGSLLTLREPSDSRQTCTDVTGARRRCSSRDHSHIEVFIYLFIFYFIILISLVILPHSQEFVFQITQWFLKKDVKGGKHHYCILGKYQVNPP